MYKCLFKAGPNILLAFAKLSSAALKTALFSDFKHFYNKVKFYLTIYATILFSSIISFGSNLSKLYVDLILSSNSGFIGNSLSIILRRSSKDI
jgi:hypothetical protein